jgi:hypothetical protein
LGLIGLSLIDFFLPWGLLIKGAFLPLYTSAPARKKWDNMLFCQGLFVAVEEPLNPFALAGVRACKEKMG